MVLISKLSRSQVVQESFKNFKLSKNTKNITYMERVFPKEYGRLKSLTEHMVLWTLTEIPRPDSRWDSSSSRSKLLQELGMQTPHSRLE